MFNVEQTGGRTFPTDAYRISENFFSTYGIDGVTAMDAVMQQKAFDGQANAYLEGRAVGSKEYGMDVLGVNGKKATFHDLYRTTMEMISEAHNVEGLSRERYMTLCMLDVNNLKEMNDFFGHSMGDHLLRVTVEKIKQVVRSTDMVGRVGGDEFSIIFRSRIDQGNEYQQEEVEKLLGLKVLCAVTDGQEIIQSDVQTLMNSEIHQGKHIPLRKLFGTVAVGIHSYSVSELQKQLQQATIVAKEVFRTKNKSFTEGELQQQIEEELFGLLMKTPDENMYEAKHTCKQTLTSTVAMSAGVFDIERLKADLRIKKDRLKLQEPNQNCL